MRETRRRGYVAARKRARVFPLPCPASHDTAGVSNNSRRRSLRRARRRADVKTSQFGLLTVGGGDARRADGEVIV